ncbi:hypothetical protein Tco_0798639 [Tanacetum coccineum]
MVAPTSEFSNKRGLRQGGSSYLHSFSSWLWKVSHNAFEEAVEIVFDYWFLDLLSIDLPEAPEMWSRHAKKTGCSTDYVASNMLVEQWDRCNVFVLSWILGSLSQDVYLGHVFSNNDVVVWKELQETYDRVDGSIVFNLLQKINSFKQGGLLVSEYYPFEAHAIPYGPWEESYIRIYPTSAKTDKPQASAFVSKTNDNRRNNVLKLMSLLNDKSGSTAHANMNLKGEKLLWTGIEFFGMYMFDVDCDKFVVSNQSKFLISHVSKEVWHNRIGHPA